jgi:hypothetical protein
LSIRESRLHLTLIVALLVFSLAAVGIGYGLWSKTLFINGTIETGKVHARWTLATCAEFHPWPGGGNPGEFEGKDVGKTTTLIDPIDPQILHVTIDNGYPSYAVDCQVHFTNDGTIPFIIRGTTILDLSPNLNNCTLVGNNSKTLFCDELTVKFVDNIGSQIDPGDEAASSLVVHVEQPANQLDKYEFDVLVCMAQWNEAASFEDCVAAAP